MNALEVVQHPSPNHGARRNGLVPQIVVLHYTAMTSAKAALARLSDPEAEVSAHYLISRQGEVTQLVDEERRAWHAGQGTWRGQDDVNSRSIGIELDNRGTHPFPEPQIKALEIVLRRIMERWRIAPEDVIAHSDMAPGRKSDPGRHFDWSRLSRQGLAGLASGTVPSVVDPESFCKAAQTAGYPADVPFEAVLEAARLRFAPWRTGPLRPEDYLFASRDTGR